MHTKVRHELVGEHIVGALLVRVRVRVRVRHAPVGEHSVGALLANARQRGDESLRRLGRG